VSKSVTIKLGRKNDLNSGKKITTRRYLEHRNALLRKWKSPAVKAGLPFSNG
jgi:hypothetical protein